MNTNEQNIKVSVIMPVYNSGEYLKTAVESILSQSLRDIELILVDDGSTDGSSDRCDEYARKDSRVRVIHQKNGGICNARNAALKIAQGEYIGFSDHDDEYLPGLLEDNYNRCKADNLDFIKFCKRSVTLVNEKVVADWTNHIEDKIYHRADVVPNIVWLLEHRFGSCVWDGLFKRRFLIANDVAFDPYFKMGGEDYDFIVKCMRYVDCFGTNSKAYYVHKVRKGISTSSKLNPNCMAVSRRFMEGFNGLLDSQGVKPEDIISDYTFCYTMFYLSPQTQNIMKLYPSKKDRINQMKNLKKENFYHPFIADTKISFSRSKQYALLLFLFNHGWYNVIFKMFSCKKKIS